MGTIHDELKWEDVSVYACRLLNSLEKVVFFTPLQLGEAADMVDKARADGYDIITVPFNIGEKLRGQLDVSGKPIRVLDQYVKEWNDSFSFKFIDEKDMTAKEREVFGQTPRILSFVGGKPKEVKEIKISETMRLEIFSFNEMAGLWDQSQGRIVIKRDQLKDLREYAGTLVHEIAHVKSGASDVSRDFEQQLTAYLGQIIYKSM
jgi:hypothetical protein